MTEPFKAGDEVYIDALRTLSKATITRVTKTQAIIDHGNYEQRFNINTGRRIGGSRFDSTSIRRPSAELDRRWVKQQAENARRTLAHYASREDADAIRTAYARWDKWQRAVEEGQVGA